LLVPLLPSLLEASAVERQPLDDLVVHAVHDGGVVAPAAIFIALHGDDH